MHADPPHGETRSRTGAEDPRAARTPARRTLLALVAILALGAVLRLVGMTWGLPDENHIASYRADEWRVTDMAVGLDVLHGELVPIYKEKPYFNWGTLHLYCVGLACSVANATGWIDAGDDLTERTVETSRRAHLLGRWVSALHGLVAIAVVHLLAAHWFGRRAGLAAALLQAIGPLDVLEAHCALANVTVAFWALLAVGAIGRALELGSTRAYFVAAIATGVAISAKLSNLPLLPLLSVAALWTALARPPERGFVVRSARLLLPVLGVAVLAFALASPAVLLHPGTFLAQAHHQLLVTPTRGTGIKFAETGNGFAFLFFTNLPVVLGWPLWGASLCGIAWAVARALRQVRGGAWRAPSPELAGDAVCLAWLFLTLVPLGMSQTRYMRYLVPLTPFLYIYAARFVLQLDARLARPASFALRGAALLALIYTALYSSAQVQTLRRTDPRDQAVAWFDENVPPDAHIALLDWPSHLVPPVHPFSRPFATRLTAARAAQGEGPKRLRWTLLKLDPERLLAERPDYVVYNPMELAPFLRVGVEGPSRVLELLERDYQDAAGPWSNEMRLFGVSFATGSDDTYSWAPASTTVRILERRDRREPVGG